MPPATRGQKLLKRYPILKNVPEDERPAVVRAALRQPMLIIPFLLAALLLLPLYFNEIFLLLRIEEEPNGLLRLAKYAGAVLVPVVVAVPLLSRLIVPGFIKKVMVKRGYL